MILFCLLFGIVASYLLIEKNTALNNRLLKSVFAFYFMLAMLSFSFTVSLFFKVSFTLFQAFFLLISLAYIIYEVRKVKKIAIAITFLTQVSTPLLVVVLMGLSLFSYTFFDNSVRWGDWDAWAIWSQHARFLANGSCFENLFTEDIAWTHPDYPLMLPSIIAVMWKSIGYCSAYVPAVFAYLIAMSLVLMMLGSFFEKKFTFSGITIFLIMTCSSVLFPFVVSQQADTIFGTFILATMVLMMHLPNDKTDFHLLLIGFFVATCGWIKNEGLVYFVLFAFCFSVKYFRDKKVIKLFFLGAALPLLVLLVFKFNYAPSSDLVNSHNEYASKMFDFSRYISVYDFARNYIVENCQLLLYVMIAILFINYKYYFSFPFVVVFWLLAAYFFTYVLTPNDLIWHLSTSLYRLIHQVFPVLLYSIFFSANEKWTGEHSFPYRMQRLIVRKRKD